MAKEQGTKLIAQNKKARHDYAIEDKYEAGLVLTGTEVKSLREGRASLAEAFVSIDRRGEMWLENANIAFVARAPAVLPQTLPKAAAKPQRGNSSTSVSDTRCKRPMHRHAFTAYLHNRFSACAYWHSAWPAALHACPALHAAPAACRIRACRGPARSPP